MFNLIKSETIFCFALEMAVCGGPDWQTEAL